MGLEAGESEKGLEKAFFSLPLLVFLVFPLLVPSFTAELLVSRMLLTDGGCKMHGGWYFVGMRISLLVASISWLGLHENIHLCLQV